MKDYQCTITFSAPSQKVYEAITSQKGIESWWTRDCEIETRLGGKSTTRFGNTYNVMQLEKLTPTEVQWKCIDQHHESEQLSKDDEWIGTHVIFLIKQIDHTHTELHFTHKGLNASMECFDICKKGWDHFIKKSLKEYVEHGKGQPWE